MARTTQHSADQQAATPTKHGLYAVPPHAPAPATTDLAPMAPARDVAQHVAQPPAVTAPYQRTRWPDDIDVIFEKDPAARNLFEVLTYQGLHAILLHRVAHRLYMAGMPFVPRLISQIARVITGGIEIHPGARIGKRFFIDHGAGVVIGETAEIGDNVMLYHQVTLGATGWWKHRGDGRVKRHPTIEDNVTIGVGASILGPVTVGHDSKIGAMALVLENIPPHSLVVSQPARLLTQKGGQADLETQLGDERPYLLDYTI
ncbi:MAG TPA: serine O-acetyltransferase EpsC [Ktedonobacterales bacterium]|nr:serine O-acetyltransferase EpsC [Ktedonobacterales bacterium]